MSATRQVGKLRQYPSLWKNCTTVQNTGGEAVLEFGGTCFQASALWEQGEEGITAVGKVLDYVGYFHKAVKCRWSGESGLCNPEPFSKPSCDVSQQYAFYIVSVEIAKSCWKYSEFRQFHDLGVLLAVASMWLV